MPAAITLPDLHARHLERNHLIAQQRHNPADRPNEPRPALARSSTSSSETASSESAAAALPPEYRWPRGPAVLAHAADTSPLCRLTPIQLLRRSRPASSRSLHRAPPAPFFAGPQTRSSESGLPLRSCRPPAPPAAAASHPSVRGIAQRSAVQQTPIAALQILQSAGQASSPEFLPCQFRASRFMLPPPSDSAVLLIDPGFRHAHRQLAHPRRSRPPAPSR